MTTENPEHWMKLAVEESRKGYPMPNPHVGCAIVRDGVLVGKGYHDHAGGPHAEVVALNVAAEKARGATAYVTLEPCNHYGKTPPCSQALIKAGVVKVVIGCQDPNPVAQGGANALQKAGLGVVLGVLEEECREANRMWLHAMERRRPYVVLKVAMALDGRIALPDGTSKWITGEGARAEGHALRAQLGAVLVGANTYRLDKPQLTARIPDVVNQPRKFVLDPKVSVELPNDVTRITETNLSEMLSQLFEEGVRGLLVEGGAATLAAFIEQGCYDQLEVFIGKKLLGQGLTWYNSMPQMMELTKFTLRSVVQHDQDVQLSYF